MKIVSFDIGVRNLAECAVEDGRVREWSVCDVLAEGGCQRKLKQVSIADLVPLLLRFLDARKARYATFAPDVVLIEQQPSSRFCPNTRTKVLSHVTQAWFVSNGFRVRFVSPKNPKSLFADRADPKAKQSKRYARNKRLSIEACQTRIEDQPEWLAWFSGLSKKDDASDAFLQAVCGAIATAAAGASARMDNRRMKERTRVLTSAVYAVALIMWPLCALVVVRAYGGTVNAAICLGIGWTMLLLAADLVGANIRRRDQLDVEASRYGTLKTVASAVVGGAWALGALLSVINGRDAGHTVASAKIVMLSLVVSVACVLPTPCNVSRRSVAGIAIASGQKCALHYAIGLFILGIGAAVASDGKR